MYISAIQSSLIMKVTSHQLDNKGTNHEKTLVESIIKSSQVIKVSDLRVADAIPETHNMLGSVTITSVRIVTAYR